MLYNSFIPVRLVQNWCQSPRPNIGYKIDAETTEPERNYAQLQLLKEMVKSVSAALPAFEFSWLIRGFPHFLVSPFSQFPGIRAASSNKKCLLLNFLQCCWPSDPVSPSLHLLLCFYLNLSHPTAFLTSWSVVSSYCCPTLVVRWTVLLS